jgi:hypothetical protein
MGGAVDGWTFDVAFAFALMTVVLAMFAEEGRRCGALATPRKRQAMVKAYSESV